MKKAKSTTVVLIWTVALLMLSGCEGIGWWNWFDPSKPIRTEDQAMLNPIFTQIGPADRTMELPPNATFPTAHDLLYEAQDYVIGPSDILRISVLDLLQDGLETVMDRQVSYSGYIDLLLSGSVKATGLTEEQLVERIKERYRPNILKYPSVSVSVVGPRQNVFSIRGAIGRPGTFSILRKDFTLLEALALAGDLSQTNIDWLYVIRPIRQVEDFSPPAEAMDLPPLPALPTTEPATNPSAETLPAAGTQTRSEQMEELARVISTGGQITPTTETASASAQGAGAAGAATAGQSVTDDWVYSGGQWANVPRSATPKALRPAEQEPGQPTRDKFGWSKWDMSGKARIIAIDIARLDAGDPQMNIIIRNNDIIHIPPLDIGEFYIMGEVLRPGVYSLTGRKVTAKMAVAAAGNLGPLSWPNNSILIRRVGNNQEQIMPLRLQDIFHGREPDIFLKPNDMIAVGSYWAAPILAVWRNAFRMTYGFGFIYDRNYSEREFEIPLIAPSSGYRGF